MKINLDSPVIVFLTTVADFMMLNILFILCCAPVITIGPAVSALYTITMREARHEGGYIFKPFFKAFKNNFKQAFPETSCQGLFIKKISNSIICCTMLVVYVIWLYN